MPTSNDKHEAARLETFFEAARAHPTAPSPALMAAVLRAAETAQPEQPPVPLLARLRDAFGGWPAMAGLATAAAAGVWIGAALPEGIIGAAGGAVDAGYAGYLVDIAPELAFDLAGDF